MKRIRRCIVLTIAMASVLSTAHFSHAQSEEDIGSMRDKAEALYQDGAYARAHEAYKNIAPRFTDAVDKRWIEFRLADTLWRSQASTNSPDDTLINRARKSLQELIRQITREEQRDLVWVESNESLADSHWVHRRGTNWSQASSHYQQALDWWAGSKDIDPARKRYLAIVKKMANAPWNNSLFSNVHSITFPIVENAASIATTNNDKAWTQYLLGMMLSQRGHAVQQRRVPTAFETALSLGRSTDWYDDALFNYAQWYAQRGPTHMDNNGQWQQKPDYLKAVALFKRLISEFRKGQTQYWDNANRWIKQITGTQVNAAVSNIYLPDSKMQFQLSWRNTKRIDLTIHAIDFTRHVDFAKSSHDRWQWIHHVDLTATEHVRSWTHETGDQGRHEPGNELIRIDEPLPVGSYILEAQANGTTSREMLLVTDMSVIVKTSGPDAIVYCCDAIAGAPVADARIRFWDITSDHRNGRRIWTGRDFEATTNKEGICTMTLPDMTGNRQYFVGAAKGSRQAFDVSHRYGKANRQAEWRIYAYTDRPAYRPGDLIQWKIIARTYDGSKYDTPAGREIKYELRDPRGTVVKEATTSLSDFGSAFDSLELTGNDPLGQYNIVFRLPDERDRQIGSATLFRLEEYKLPEFKVSVRTPEEDGKPATYILGDKVDVEIACEYYFGGPVSGADVQVVVHQRSFHHTWTPTREYSWCYREAPPHYGWHGWHGNEIKRETLRTDEEGVARLAFETPIGEQNDLEYTITANVTDASRREISSRDSVRVTRQRFYVYPRAEHNIYAPKDKVSITFKALDANDNSVEAEGTVHVTREVWKNVWINPEGRQIIDPFRRGMLHGSTHEAVRLGWRKSFEGYASEEILKRAISTDDEGHAELVFTPQKEGYYKVVWTSPQDDSMPVQGETTIWVAEDATRQLGYHHQGVDIIVDKESFRAGDTAPVMLSTETNNRYVLFSVEGESIHNYQLVHVTGAVKLIRFPITATHIPNIWLDATMVADAQWHRDQEYVVVPPVEQFLDVEVMADREAYEPGDTGTIDIVAKDVDGNPVNAEFSMALYDEAVSYIQTDYAQDPRQFFFDRKQIHRVGTSGTFQHKPYVTLVEFEDQLVDERAVEYLKNEAAWAANDRDFRDANGFAQFGSKLQQSLAPPPRSAAAPMESEDLAMDAAAGSDQWAFEKTRTSGLTGLDVGQTRGGGMGGGGGFDEEEPVVQVRADFRATALWLPDVKTDSQGRASVDVTFPDSLTQWRAVSRIATSGNKFGIGESSVRTRMPLIVRLQAPRFFVVGDKVVISAVLNNNTDEPMTVKPAIEVKGIVLRQHDLQTPVTVPANGESRVDWIAHVTKAGQAKIKVVGKGNRYADAMERSYSVYDHGIEKFIAASGKVRGDAVNVSLNLPSERREGSTTMTVQVTPSIAITMLDALPYLIDYPYGCTEQTMSRFLPAVITTKTLKDLGLEPADVAARIFGGIVPELVDKAHPKAKRYLDRLDEVTRFSLERLYDFQHSDGGWGWWKHGSSDHFMTAYIVWGLAIAQDAGLDVRADALQRGAAYLNKELVEQEFSVDMQAWMLHALSAYHTLSGNEEISKFERKALDNIWRQADRLNAYSRALAALSAHAYGDEVLAKKFINVLENGVKRDDRPDRSILVTTGNTTNPAVIPTAHWGEDGVYWRWSDGGVEATAMALRALLTIAPGHELIEPVTNWLVRNRRGAQWSNTRDTAMVVLALNEYLRTSGELAADLEYELFVNGASIAKKTITPAEVVAAPSRFEIDPQLLRNGDNTVRIMRNDGGKGSLYFSAEATYFSLEEPITSAGNEIFVRRDYFKLVPKQTLLKGYVHERVPLHDGETVVSGQRIEVIATVESKNHLEYMIFEDLKPAGFEAVQVRSGEIMYAKQLALSGIEHRFGEDDDLPAARDDTDYTGQTQWLHQELRDRKIAIFASRLKEGAWEIRYELRAEVPGEFHALPLMAHAMYVPEIRANGQEVRVTVEDRVDN